MASSEKSPEILYEAKATRFDFPQGTPKWKQFSFMTLGLSILYKDYIKKKVKKILMPHEGKRIPRLLEERKKIFTREEPIKNLEGFVQTIDGAQINFFCHFSLAEEKEAFEQKKAQNQKWLVFLNGSGEFYERKFKEGKVFSDFLQGNYLLFNYRSLGKSQGFFEKPVDLIWDGEAVLQFLLDRGVELKNIVLIGRSLGGGVAAQLVSKYEETYLISINSFSRLSDMPFGLYHPFGWPIQKIMLFYNWEFNTLKALEKVSSNRFLVVYNRLDNIIPYKRSSLAWHLEKQKRSFSCISLETQASHPHPDYSEPLIFFSSQEDFEMQLEQWQKHHFSEQIQKSFWALFSHLEEKKGKTTPEIEAAFEKKKEELWFDSPHALEIFIQETKQKISNQLQEEEKSPLNMLIDKGLTVFLKESKIVLSQWEVFKKAPKIPLKAPLDPHSIPAARDPQGLQDILDWLKKRLG